MSLSAVSAPAAIAADGPNNFPNSAIADHAEAYANGAFGNSCLIFAANMITAAGDPGIRVVGSTDTYQEQWSRQAASVAEGDLQRGDIVQWGGERNGGPGLHTAIITAGGANPQLIDSNWGSPGNTVHRGSLSSRDQGERGVIRKFWRVGIGDSSTPSLAFQANTGELYTTGSTGTINTHLGMMAGTSPAIAASLRGGDEVTFQANTGSLYTFSSSTGAANLGLGMMRGTSPSITALPTGGYQLAFQANTGELYTTESTGTINTHLGMMAGTSPGSGGL